MFVFVDKSGLNFENRQCLIQKNKTNMLSKFVQI